MSYILHIIISYWFFGSIQAQPCKDKTGDIFRVVYDPPLTITQIQPSNYFIDFGKAAFGTLVIRSMEKDIDSLVVHLGEKLKTTGTIDRNPVGTIRYQRIVVRNIFAGQDHEIQLVPDKRNTSGAAIQLPDSFGVIMPFRYAEIENLHVPVDEMSFKQKMFHYSFDDSASYFISSDTLLNQVWDLCKYTIKATSFAGLYIDGDRERIPYEADAYINQLSHYAVDKEYCMARQTNNYFLEHPTWPTEWILHTVLLFYNDFMYTGDISAVAEHYGELKHKTLIDLQREDGLISTKTGLVDGYFMQKIGFKDTSQRIKDIVDWPPGQKDTGWKLATEEGERDGYDMSVKINTVVNAFHYINLEMMRELAGYLGKGDDSVFFAREAEQVKSSINQKLLDKNKGIYLDGENSGHSSLHANMLPLAFGIVPDKYMNSVIDFVKSRGMACSVYGAQYLLEGLYRYGEAGYGHELITSTGERSWYNMIRAGSTMTLEAWDIKYKPNLDWNHAWGAAPANIITRHAWGIRPEAPGFGKAIIQPRLNGLTFSKIKAPTIIGSVYGEYKVNGKVHTYKIIVPERMEARFIVPVNNPRNVLLNGEKLSLEKTQIVIREGENLIEIQE